MLKLFQGLLAKVAAIDQKQNALGAGELDQAVGDVAEMAEGGGTVIDVDVRVRFGAGADAGQKVVVMGGEVGT